MFAQKYPNIRSLIEDEIIIKDFLRHLLKLLKEGTNYFQFLSEAFSALRDFLKSNSEHPKLKLQSHKVKLSVSQLFMYLLLLGDPQVYAEFEEKILLIFKGNCLYNRTMPLKSKGEDFFKKTKFFTETKNVHEKNDIKMIGIDYIRFCHETVYNLAKWIPFNLENEKQPTKFAIVYSSLKRQGIEFPKEKQFLFYQAKQIQLMEEEIKEFQKEAINSVSFLNSGSLVQLQTNSEKGKGSMVLKSTQNKRSSLSVQNNRLKEERQDYERNLKEQKNEYEGKLKKLKAEQEESIGKYELKIEQLSKEIQKMKDKIVYLQSKTVICKQTNDEKKFLSQLQQKDQIINDLTKHNQSLLLQVQRLSSKTHQLKTTLSQLSEAEIQKVVTKLKKQNKNLKHKILAECLETNEFRDVHKGLCIGNMKDSICLNFLSYKEGREPYEPFYSNSSSENKIRLKKAILREKQLLYKDKNIQVGCITKLQSRNCLRMMVVCTNISQKPLLSLLIEFINRQDTSIQLLTQPKQSLEIAGQTKTQLLITIKNIDFRCILCCLNFFIEESQYKVPLILPVTKLKLIKEQVFTPVSGKKQFSKIQKLINPEKKILPYLQKFKEYFKMAIEERDRTNHETFNLKIEFLDCRFYIECDEVGAELRIGVKYEEGHLGEGEKLLNELVFIFGK